ncbi:MAG: hypothetical protein IOC67_01185, partial [Methylobacterium sp.]|nr:hypothetical protein [Methylobacterium sp.]
AQSEEAIRSTLFDLASGRTTILVAHRLASVVGADRIVVMERGEIIEAGDHMSLLAKEGAYAGLFRLQMGAAR